MTDTPTPDADGLDQRLAALSPAPPLPKQQEDALWTAIAADIAASAAPRAKTSKAPLQSTRRTRTPWLATAAVLVLSVLAGAAWWTAGLSPNTPAPDILVANGDTPPARGVAKHPATLAAWQTIPASYRAAELEVLAALPQDTQNAVRNRARQEQTIRALEAESARLRTALEDTPDDLALINALLATERQRLTLVQTIARSLRDPDTGEDDDSGLTPAAY